MALFLVYLFSLVTYNLILVLYFLGTQSFLCLKAFETVAKTFVLVKHT